MTLHEELLRRLGAEVEQLPADLAAARGLAAGVCVLKIDELIFMCCT